MVRSCRSAGLLPSSCMAENFLRRELQLGREMVSGLMSN